METIMTTPFAECLKAKRSEGYNEAIVDVLSTLANSDAEDYIKGRMLTIILGKGEKGKC